MANAIFVLLRWGRLVGGELFVHLHEFCHTFGLGVEFAPEAVGLHNGFVVGAVGFEKLRRHGYRVVEVGKAGVWVEGAGIQDGLSGLFDGGALFVGGRGPREVIVDDILQITIIAFQSAADRPHRYDSAAPCC